MSTELALGQRLALLLLRRGRSADNLAAKVVARLERMGVAGPAKADWRTMIDARYVVRQGILRLTPSGLAKADSICGTMATKLGIHHVVFGRSQGSYGPYVACTCGWNTHTTASKTALLTLSRHATKHLRQAKDGTLPAAYALPQSALEQIAG